MVGFVDLFVVVIPVAIALALIVATRGICYLAGHTQSDSEKTVRMAGEISLLAWPSRMHAIPYGRGQLREYWVIALKLLMKITGMKESDHVTVTLGLIANAASSVLIFYIARSYFGELSALFVFLLYITSIWPYHVAILMGHIHLSQALFLFSILALRLATGHPDVSLLFYLASGILIGMSFSSSSSSRKFPPLFLAAFLYETRDYFILPYASGFETTHLLNGGAVATSASLVLPLATIAAFASLLGTVIVKALNRRLGRNWSAAKLTELAARVSQKLRVYAVIGIVIVATFYVLQLDARLYASAAACLAGMFLVMVHVLWPNLVVNSLRYMTYLNQTNWVSHFQGYKPYHEEIFGRTLPHNFRGGGISWVPRLLMRMIPVEVVIYLVVAIAILGIYLSRVISDDLNPIAAALSISTLIFVSLLPPIVSEQTKSLQVGKSYFPSLLGLLILIGAGAATIIEFAEGNPVVMSAWALIATLLILAQVVMTTRGLVTDRLPARMAASRLYRLLKDYGVKAFYTYDNPYNRSFVHTMLYSHPGEFEVRYIDTIKNVRDGVVVVPPTSSKSFVMESESFAAQNGDFRADAALNELLDSRHIENVVLARLNTMGCSRYFVQESEVTSYRDIILKQINDHDRWLGYGWVVDAKRLKFSD